MNKQQALKQLQELVDNGFAFYVDSDYDLTYKVDKILNRVYKFTPFDIGEVLEEGDLYNNHEFLNAYCCSWDYYGVSVEYGTYFLDGYFSDLSYGDYAKEVSPDYVEMLLEILEKEDTLVGQHPEVVDSVRAIAQNRVDTNVGIEISLSQVPFTLSPSQAKVLADSIYTTLEQFTSSLSVGDIVSDNDQSLVVYGVDNDKIWCKNEQSGKYFTHSREQLIKMEKN